MASVTEDLEAFVARHRSCGDLTGDATDPTPSGYLVWIRCPCGVVFQRWVTSDEAALDLAMLHLRAGN